MFGIDELQRKSASRQEANIGIDRGIKKKFAER
jgi:hypothetical protein